MCGLYTVGYMRKNTVWAWNDRHACNSVDCWDR